MTQDQQKFYDFLMQRVQDGKADEARELLLENFRLQDEGKFTKEAMARQMPKIMALVKPECLDDLKNAAAHMGSTL